ncbi:helix-turn-helix domain-containing protein [Embleya sp. AB8]|uniref:helix-turn-helix domain-containing protein n=1 Tax=Embleya sp. AB8 TaxID=3156304 RepID=UPI003C76D525
MPANASPTVRARTLGRELRKARETAGWSLDQAAQALGVNKATISRVELGRTGVRQRDVRALLMDYGVTDEQSIEALVMLSRHGRTQGWWRKHGEVTEAYGDYLGLEQQSHEIRTFEAFYIPGLLQTSDYSRAVLAASVLATTDERATELTRVREERQRLLFAKTSTVTLSCVMSEAAIRTPVGGSAVMHEQLGRLLELHERPQIKIQVLPFERGAHAGMTGAFVIFSFPAIEEVDIVYTENLPGAVFFEQQEDARKYRRAFESLSADALSPKESIEIIADAMRGMAN